MRLLITTIILCTSIFDNSYSQRVVGYYPQWVQGNLNPSEIDYSVITHVNHAFAWPDEEGNILHYDDMISQSITSVVHDHGAKILLSLGGWGNSWGFAPSVESEEARSIFIDNIISICENNNYDGIDIDWEHPDGFTQKNNLSDFIAELRQAFDELYPEWLISMAVPVSNWSGQHYDFNSLIQNVSYFNAMTYDFHGSWTDHAGHNAPLYPSPANDPDGAVSTGFYYLSNTRGIPRSKINIGLAFYGKQYNALDINQSFQGEVASLLYNQYEHYINNGWDYNWDNTAQSPYLRNSAQDQIITIEDSNSIARKSDYVKNNQIGGLMIWALSYDYVGGNQLLINSIKNNYLTVDNKLNPEEYSIDIKNYPNPFNSNTIIDFYITNDSKVDLKIFDIMGNLVRNLVSDRMPSGLKKINWDGTNNNREDIAAGVYFYQLIVNETLFSNKMVYLK
jgi:chitinase